MCYFWLVENIWLLLNVKNQYGFITFVTEIWYELVFFYHYKRLQTIVTVLINNYMYKLIY